MWLSILNLRRKQHYQYVYKTLLEPRDGCLTSRVAWIRNMSHRDMEDVSSENQVLTGPTSPLKFFGCENCLVHINGTSTENYNSTSNETVFFSLGLILGVFISFSNYLQKMVIYGN